MFLFTLKKLTRKGLSLVTTEYKASQMHCSHWSDQIRKTWDSKYIQVHWPNCLGQQETAWEQQNFQYTGCPKGNLKIDNLFYIYPYFSTKMLVITIGRNWYMKIRPCFYQNGSPRPMDQGLTWSSQCCIQFCPLQLLKYCEMWEGLSRTFDTKFHNCRGKIIDRGVIVSWSLNQWIKVIRFDKVGTMLKALAYPACSLVDSDMPGLPTSTQILLLCSDSWQTPWKQYNKTDVGTPINPRPP